MGLIVISTGLAKGRTGHCSTEFYKGSQQQPRTKAKAKGASGNSPIARRTNPVDVIQVFSM